MTGWEVPQESLWRVRGAAPASWIPACAGMTIKRVGQGEFDESVGIPHCLSRWSFLPPIETFGDRRQQESMRSYRGNDLTGRLLGHRRTTTTNRYAHLDDATLIGAAELVAGAVQRKLDPRA